MYRARLSGCGRRGRTFLAPLLILAGIPGLASAQSMRIQPLMPNQSGAFLGIQMEDVTADNAAKFDLSGEKGVIVRSVEEGSPAEKAGLQENDVILEYAGFEVFSTLQMSRLVHETPVGRTVDLTVSRSGKTLHLSATPAERPRESGQQGIWMLPEGGGYSFRIPRGMPGRPGFRFEAPFDTGKDRPAKPRLGVTLEPLTEQLGEFLGVTGGKGALVTSVEKGSAAASKLKAGDVIVAMDGKKVESPDDVSEHVRNAEDGARVEMKIVRNKEEMSVAVELAKKTQGFKM